MGGSGGNTEEKPFISRLCQGCRLPFTTQAVSRYRCDRCHATKLAMKKTIARQKELKKFLRRINAFDVRDVAVAAACVEIMEYYTWKLDVFGKDFEKVMANADARTRFKFNSVLISLLAHIERREDQSLREIQAQPEPAEEKGNWKKEKEKEKEKYDPRPSRAELKEFAEQVIKSIESAVSDLEHWANFADEQRKHMNSDSPHYPTRVDVLATRQVIRGLRSYPEKMREWFRLRKPLEVPESSESVESVEVEVVAETELEPEATRSNQS